MSYKFYLLIIVGCSYAVSSVANGSLEAVADSIKIHIESSNLSEDVSRVSSKNDELILLIYEIPDSLVLHPPAFHKKILFTKTNSSQVFDWIKAHNQKYDFICFLIEQDSQASFERINASIRIYHKEIYEHYRKKEYLGIEKYLGDEDVLGIQYFHLKTGEPLELVFQGMQKLDKYSYTLKFY